MNFVEQFSYNVEIIQDHYFWREPSRNPLKAIENMRISGGKRSHVFDPLCQRRRSLKCLYAFKILSITIRYYCSLEKKIAEIVKVGEAIKDWIKTRKIYRVAAPTKSSGLFKKKIEVVCSISVSFDGKGHFKKPSRYKVYPRVLKDTYPSCYTQSCYQTPRVGYKNPPPNYQTLSSSYQIPPYNYKTPPPS